MGAMSVLITNPRDMKSMIKDIKAYPFTAITGVNILFNGLINQPDFCALDFSTLKLSLGGGCRTSCVADVDPNGKPLLEGYGLTEAALSLP